MRFNQLVYSTNLQLAVWQPLVKYWPKLLTCCCAGLFPVISGSSSFPLGVTHVLLNMTWKLTLLPFPSVVKYFPVWYPWVTPNQAVWYSGCTWLSLVTPIPLPFSHYPACELAWVCISVVVYTDQTAACSSQEFNNHDCVWDFIRREIAPIGCGCCKWLCSIVAAHGWPLSWLHVWSVIRYQRCCCLTVLTVSIIIVHCY